MSINPALLAHGVFIELSPLKSLQRYADFNRLGLSIAAPASETPKLVANFISALHFMRIGGVWIQLFNRHGEIDPDGKRATRELVEGLRAANIKIVGWGYCHSERSAVDLDLAKRVCAKYGIEAFAADVEPGNVINGMVDTWQPIDFLRLITGLNQHFGKENLAISTFARLDLQPEARDLMKLGRQFVGLYAPQVYWMKNDPVGFAEATIASWRNSGINHPLVLTAQSYWDTAETPPQTDVESKLAEFVSAFPNAGWSKIAGLNWYHAGGSNTEDEGAMSDGMIGMIAVADIPSKPFAAPQPTFPGTT